jgi:hypothetical protein
MLLILEKLLIVTELLVKEKVELMVLFEMGLAGKKEIRVDNKE